MIARNQENNILPREFYERSTLSVAADLLGKELVFNHKKGIIFETEAYIGKIDDACHGARGITPRTEVMFGPAGFSYVYMTYGIYFCMNIITEFPGSPSGVLLRGVVDIEQRKIIDGPGKLCREFHIDKRFNNQDMTKNHEFCVYDRPLIHDYICTRRIGLSKGKNKYWRFVTDPKKIVIYSSA